MSITQIIFEFLFFIVLLFLCFFCFFLYFDIGFSKRFNLSLFLTFLIVGICSFLTYLSFLF